MKNIVLIGMSGSGKTSVGRFISKKLSMKLMYTDDIVINNNNKMSIPYIFDEYGEDYFRNLEKRS